MLFRSEFEDIRTVYIADDVKIGKGTYIGPCVTLEAGTEIGENCRIYQRCYPRWQSTMQPALLNCARSLRRLINIWNIF